MLSQFVEYGRSDDSDVYVQAENTDDSDTETCSGCDDSDTINASPFIVRDSTSDTVQGGRARILYTKVPVVHEKFIPSAVFKPGECAPTVGNDDGVCSTGGTVERIKEWIAKQKAADLVHTAKDVIEHAKKVTKCESESCIYTKRSALLEYITPALAKRELLERFAPKGPHNSTDWLSNDNIDQVLELYVKKFPQFYHVPYQMADFEKYGGELASVDFQTVSKTYKSLGCVLNTDKHGGPGQHWVALYVDFQGQTFEYWDSAGSPPFDEIHNFMVNTVEQLNAAGGKYKPVVVCKDIVHQKADTECGVYSLYFIINRLNGIPYKFFQSNEIPDSVMEQFRKYLFRHS